MREDQEGGRKLPAPGHKTWCRRLVHSGLAGWRQGTGVPTVLSPQLFLMVAGMFLYGTGNGAADPYLALFMNTRLGLSLTAIGLIYGVAQMAAIPVQLISSAVADDYGRRYSLTTALLTEAIVYSGLALVGSAWQAIALIALSAAFGWTLFMTSSNAIVADLVPPPRMLTAFGISRVSLSIGNVLGPVIAGVALASGASYRALFLGAAGCCVAFLIIELLWLRDSRPAETRRDLKAPRRTSVSVLLRDRRFVFFGLVTLLPLYGCSQLEATYPLYLTKVLGVSVRSWGLLWALYALVGAAAQYPLVRVLRRHKPMMMMVLASMLIGCGLGATTLTHGGWPLVGLTAMTSAGVILLATAATTITAAMAPAELRARYMGGLTIIWMAGQALGMMVGGFAMESLGGRTAYAVVLGAGVVGSLLFLHLSKSGNDSCTDDEQHGQRRPMPSPSRPSGR